MSLVETDQMKLSKEIGLDWFKVHADQRLKVFNFFLLIAGFCIGGFFTALPLNRMAAAVIAFVLAVVCVCFKLLDRRTAELVKHGEQLIEYCLDRVGDKAMPNPIQLANKRNENLSCREVWFKGTLSYRQIFNILFIVFGAMSAAGMISAWFLVQGCKS
jgi:hypothetical protein